MLLKQFPVLFLVIIFSCKNGEPQNTPQPQAKAESLTGLWISKTYTDSLEKYTNARFNNSYGCTELYIRQNKVFVLNGEWQPVICKLQKLPGHILRIVGSKKDSFVDLELENGRLVQQEPFHHGSYKMVFVRADSSITEPINAAGFTSSVRQATNEKLFAGTYRTIINSPIPPERGVAVEVSREITFHRDGSITGLGDYKHYKICTEGDCKRYCDEMTLVYLSHLPDEPGGKWYCWQREGSTLKIYHAISKEWMSNWPDIQPDVHWLELRRRGD
ncbi:MAG: hypothetical protein EXR21_00685 [Flavobacteriaceae bacterium]|nr:hypothetical protein [Flavobacteriaceae bacterium]